MDLSPLGLADAVSLQLLDFHLCTDLNSSSASAEQTYGINFQFKPVA